VGNRDEGSEIDVENKQKEERLKSATLYNTDRKYIHKCGKPG